MYTRRSALPKKTKRNLFLPEIFIVYLFKFVFYFTRVSQFLTIVLKVILLKKLQLFFFSNVKSPSTYYNTRTFGS